MPSLRPAPGPSMFEPCPSSPFFFSCFAWDLRVHGRRLGASNTPATFPATLTTKRRRNPRQQRCSPWVWSSPRPARPQDAKACLDCLTHPDSAWCRRGSTRRLTKREEPHHELESGAGSGSGFWSMPRQATQFNAGYARCGECSEVQTTQFRQSQWDRETVASATIAVPHP